MRQIAILVNCLAVCILQSSGVAITAQDATCQLSQRIDASPADASAYIERAKLFRIAKKYSEEYSDIRTALKLQPGSTSLAREYLINLICQDFQRGELFGVNKVVVTLEKSDPHVPAESAGTTANLARRFNLSNQELESCFAIPGVRTVAKGQTPVTVSFRLTSSTDKSCTTSPYEVSMVISADFGETGWGRGLGSVGFANSNELRTRIKQLVKELTVLIQKDNDAVAEERMQKLIELREESIYLGFAKTRLMLQADPSINWTPTPAHFKAAERALAKAGIEIAWGDSVKLPLVLVEVTPYGSLLRRTSPMKLAIQTHLKQPNSIFRYDTDQSSPPLASVRELTPNAFARECTAFGAHVNRARRLFGEPKLN